jgi:hypothetical protein
MAVVLSERLSERLQSLAAAQNISVEALIEEVLNRSPAQTGSFEALAAAGRMMPAFDGPDDIAENSRAIIQEELEKAFQEEMKQRVNYESSAGG